MPKECPWDHHWEACLRRGKLYFWNVHDLFPWILKVSAVITNKVLSCSACAPTWSSRTHHYSKAGRGEGAALPRSKFVALYHLQHLKKPKLLFLFLICSLKETIYGQKMVLLCVLQYLGKFDNLLLHRTAVIFKVLQAQ